MKTINEFIAETLNEYPSIIELGDGEYRGILWGHCFLYENKKYYSPIGWKNMFPSYCNMTIKEGKIMPQQVDIYQRKELKKLF